MKNPYDTSLPALSKATSNEKSKSDRGCLPQGHCSHNLPARPTRVHAKCKGQQKILRCDMDKNCQQHGFTSHTWTGKNRLWKLPSMKAALGKSSTPKVYLRYRSETMLSKKINKKIYDVVWTKMSWACGHDRWYRLPLGPIIWTWRREREKNDERKK